MICPTCAPPGHVSQCERRMNFLYSACAPHIDRFNRGMRLDAAHKRRM
jgi:hypothetical protein